MPHDAMPAATGIVGQVDALVNNISMVPASEIFGRPSTPVPWQATAAALEAAIAILPTLDDATARLVEDLAVLLVDKEDELRAVRLVLSEAMTLSHRQYVEIARLKRRLADLLDARQANLRVSALLTSRPTATARPRTSPRTTQALNTKNNNNHKDNRKPSASPRASQTQGQGQVP